MALEWNKRYSISRARIGKVGDLVVAWGASQKTSPGYEVSVFGTRLKDNSPDEDEGKRRAVRLAKKLLAEASAILDDAEQVQTGEAEMLKAKSIKATIVLDPAEAAALDVPESGKRFTTRIQVAGIVIEAELNAKTLRKSIAAIREHGPENVGAFIQGKLMPNSAPIPTLEEAAIMAMPRAKKEEP